MRCILKCTHLLLLCYYFTECQPPVRPLQLKAVTDSLHRTKKAYGRGQWENITVQNQKGDQEGKHYFSISLE